MSSFKLATLAILGLTAADLVGWLDEWPSMLIDGFIIALAVMYFV